MFAKNKKVIIYFVVALASMPIWDLFNWYDVLSDNAVRALWMLSLTVFIYCSFKLLIDFKIESQYLKILFFILLLYEFFIVIRGFSFSYYGLVAVIREPQCFWPFIIPFFIFFDKRFFTLVFIMKWLFRLGVVFLLLVLCIPSLLLQRLTATVLISALGIGCGFLLLNATYLSNKKVNVAFLVMLLSSLSLIYHARRSTVVTFLGLIFFSYVINLFSKSRSWLFKLFPLLLGLLLFISFNVESFTNSLTERMKDRLFEDSRSELYQMFFIQMEDFMLFGKGMNATYYYPMDETVQDDGIIYPDEEYRNIIENGYLQLLLNGGITYIVLFLLILLPAAFKGIFQSSNQFTRACGALILLWLIDMSIYGLPTLSIHYVLVWICAGICYKKSMRQKTNDEIREEFIQWEGRQGTVLVGKRERVFG